MRKNRLVKIGPKPKRSTVLFYLPDLGAGGAERVTLNIACQLANSGFDVVLVVGSTTGIEHYAIPNLVKVISLKSSRTLYSIFKLGWQIKKISPSIAFSSLNRANILLISLKLFNRKLRVIVREPNLPTNQAVLLPRVTFTLTRWLYRFANGVVVQTPEMKAEVERFYRVDPGKVDFILNPLNTSLIDSLAYVKPSPFLSSKKSLVSIGTLDDRKGFDLLIDAVAIVKECRSDFKLYIIGSGDREGDLRSQVMRLGLEDYISFAGFQENPYVFLRNCDLVISSSRMEGLPNIILEALYLKKRVVVSNSVPFISSVVEDNNVGLVVAVGDPLALGKAILKALDAELDEMPDNFFKDEFSDYFNKVETS